MRVGRAEEKPKVLSLRFLLSYGAEGLLKEVSSAGVLREEARGFALLSQQ